MSLRTSYPVAHHVARARVPSRGYGLRKHSARRHLRASRRGIAALTATLFLAGILLSLSSLWAAGQARQKIAGEAALVAEAVARAGYGLHHWLHEGGSTACDRFVFSVERNPPPGGCDLLDHGAWADWAQPPRGWEIIIDTADIADLPHGLLIVRPPGCTTERDQILHSEVAQRLGVAFDPDAYVFNNGRCNDVPAAGPALGDVQNIPTEEYDLVVFAHAFSRIDPSLVLREPRAGFAPPIMETTLNMGGHGITGTETLNAGEALTVSTDVDAVQGVDRINGALLIEAGNLEVTDPEGARAPDLNIIGNLAVRNDMMLTTLGNDSDPVNIDADFGAINTLPREGDGPDITVKNRFFCGTGCGGAP